VFGICSLLLPILCIPGIICGTRALRRVREFPARRGAGRAIAGIVTSCVFGLLGALAVAAFVVGGFTNPQMSAPRLQSGIQSLLDGEFQQHYGFTPNITVQCPNSEPREAGTEFQCNVLLVSSGARFTTQIHVTDGQGDFIVGPLEPASSAGGTPDVPASVPTTVPSAPPVVLPAAPTAPTALTGPPIDGQIAVIGVEQNGGHVTLEITQKDVTYATCSGFQAVAASGAQLGYSGLTAGDFGTATVNAHAPCVSQVHLVATPAPPQCSSLGTSGDAIVTWEGFNPSTHAVLYLPTGPNEPILAGRWCTTPAVSGANNQAMALSQIPKGAQVQLGLSNSEWITSVTVKS
jgi:hypothetical protein